MVQTQPTPWKLAHVVGATFVRPPQATISYTVTARGTAFMHRGAPSLGHRKPPYRIYGPTVTACSTGFMYRAEYAPWCEVRR